MNILINILNSLKKQIPMVWDRFTCTDEGFYVVYGWITRSDGQRDFIMITWDVAEPIGVWYTTSSAKYSAKICEILYGTAEGHNSCRKIDELFDMAKQVNAA